MTNQYKTYKITYSDYKKLMYEISKQYESLKIYSFSKYDIYFNCNRIAPILSVSVILEKTKTTFHF